jgi:hypothetical protein
MTALDPMERLQATLAQMRKIVANLEDVESLYGRFTRLSGPLREFSTALGGGRFPTVASCGLTPISALAILVFRFSLGHAIGLFLCSGSVELGGQSHFLQPD